MTDKQISYIQNQIGYTFKKKNLLLQAFTRRSYSNENPASQHYEVLEFIGDTVVKICISKNIVQDYGNINEYGQFVSSKTEGQLSQMRQSLENQANQAKCIDKLNLMPYLLMGKSDKNNNIQNKSETKDNLFESILGAVAIDCDFDINILSKIYNKMQNVKDVSNPKTYTFSAETIKKMRSIVGQPRSEIAVCKLNELNMKGYISKPKYTFEQTKSGTWTCYCSVAECTSTWHNTTPQKKKSAKQLAASGVLEDILGLKK